MKLKTLILMLAFVCLAHSCIDPVDFSEEGDSTALVVDGIITTEPGPYTVSLTRASDFNSLYSSVEWVSDAIVVISDDQGNVEILTETYTQGIYKTDPNGIQGIPGRQYKLEIETPDGLHYESNYELLRPVPEIDTVYYERQIIQELDDQFLVRDVDGFQIYMETRDPEGSKDYYLWSWIGTYEVHTQPWRFFDWKKRESAPKDCCATCWVSETSSSIRVFDDDQFGGSRLISEPVEFVRLINSNGARHFRGKYHIQVKQLSLTKQAYQYWSSIANQISSSGSIFEPAPVAIIGNITNCDDPDDIAFGYFGASAISTKSTIIPAHEVPTPPDDFLDWPDDCRTLSNSTALMPAFW